jgi:hypothetical protein
VRAALDDLLTVAPEERRPPLERQLELLEAAVKRAFDDEDDVAANLIGDAQGIGAGPDVLKRVSGASKGVPARDRTPARPRSTS